MRKLGKRKFKKKTQVNNKNERKEISENDSCKIWENGNESDADGWNHGMHFIITLYLIKISIQIPKFYHLKTTTEFVFMMWSVFVCVCVGAINQKQAGNEYWPGLPWVPFAISHASHSPHPSFRDETQPCSPFLWLDWYTHRFPAKNTNAQAVRSCARIGSGKKRSPKFATKNYLFTFAEHRMDEILVQKRAAFDARVQHPQHYKHLQFIIERQPWHKHIRECFTRCEKCKDNPVHEPFQLNQNRRNKNAKCWDRK